MFGKLLILKSLFLDLPSKKSNRDWKPSLLISFIILAATLFGFQERFQNQFSDTFKSSGGQITSSLQRAYNIAFCDDSSKSQNSFANEVNSEIRIDKLFFNTEEEKNKYCNASHEYYLNEQSTSNVYALFFTIFPFFSLNEIQKTLMFIKFLLITIFILFMLKNGFNIFTCSFFCIYTLFLSSYEMPVDGHTFSHYILFIPAYLGFVLICMIAQQIENNRNSLFAPFLVLLIVGFYASFYSNLRSSHFPIIVCVSMIFLVLFINNYIYRNSISIKKSNIIFMLMLFFVGYKSYSLFFIDKNDSYSHHEIMHPIVLALGIESSPLAEREGIKWDDSVGLHLARKIDPGARYLGKEYESALFKYYCGLWVNNPQEMLEIYLNKIKKSTALNLETSLCSQYSHDLYRETCKIIYSTFGSGFSPLILTLMSLFLVFLFKKNISNIQFFLYTSVTISFFLFYMESFFIMHHYTQSYHALLNLLFLMILIFYAQTIVYTLIITMPKSLYLKATYSRKHFL